MFKFFKSASENKALHQELEKLRAENKITLESLQDSQQKLQSLSQDLDNFRNQQHQQSHVQTNLESINAQLNQQVQDLQQQLQDESTQKQSLQAQVTLLETDSLQVKESLNQVQRETQELHQSTQLSSSEKAELQQALTQTQAELASFKERYMKLEMQQRELQNELESLKQAAVALSPSPEAQSTKKPEDYRILIVDDSITTRTLMKRVLEIAGYQVLLAKDGLEGQNSFKSEHPDLVVTDIEMPEMDGFELTRWIKEMSERKHVPVILITSLADDDFKTRGKDVGSDGFVTKNNFNQQNFLEIVEKNLFHMV